VLPKHGWSDLSIEIFMAKLAAMDSNNYVDNAGIGEREGRVFSKLVKVRNNNFAHGIGRSGDVNALQPKAIGSSVIVKLTRNLAISALKTMGMSGVKDLIVLPFATGMALTMTLLTLKN